MIEPLIVVIVVYLLMSFVILMWWISEIIYAAINYQNGTDQYIRAAAKNQFDTAISMWYITLLWPLSVIKFLVVGISSVIRTLKED